MKKLLKPFLALTVVASCASCSDDDTMKNSSTTISEINFIGEHIIPDGEMFEGQIVGGLSGIDYHDGIYYIISDGIFIVRVLGGKMDFPKHLK